MATGLDFSWFGSLSCVCAHCFLTLMHEHIEEGDEFVSPDGERVLRQIAWYFV